MPKYYTFPTLYDEVKTVKIAFLKKHGYLKPNQWQSGTIIWSRNGVETGSISISVNTAQESPFLQLSYNYNDVKKSYQIELKKVPSNLGKGFLWFFVCPETFRLCRKLYLYNGIFRHRELCNGGMYESQTHSKKYRLLDKQFGAIFKQDEVCSELYKKHFKKTYAGKPTKKYLRLMAIKEAAKNIPYYEFERAMML